MALEAVGVRPSTPDVIADRLRRAILGGEIAGGTQLKQNDVAARFGVSVVPVREALQRLVSEGLAVLQPNKGVTVTRISEQDFLEIAELRFLLEPHALRMSAPHLSAADLKAAEEILARAAASTDPFERSELHWAFHRQLYGRAGRPRLIAQLGQLYASITRYLLPIWSRTGLSAHWTDSHLEIVDAVRAGNVEKAARLVGNQIVEARERMRVELRAILEEQESAA